MSEVQDVEMNSDSDSDESMEEDEEKQEGIPDPSEDPNDNRPNVYLPGVPLKEGEELVCDQSAYLMLHQAQSGAPCLSFDIIRDNLGDKRDTFPLTSYVVAGTQAAQTHSNSVMVMKMSNLCKTGEDDDEDSEDDEEEDMKPVLLTATIKHSGCINRIRSSKVNNVTLAATWSEVGKVNIYDVSMQLNYLDDPIELPKYKKNNVGDSISPLFTFSGHQGEGFGIDWSPMSPGVLATGDCRRHIHIWKPADGATWRVDQRPLKGHKDSVEDIQWSPNEQSVLASCSVDKSIRIWDIRIAPSKACMLAAEDSHDSDVNVISWNRNEPFIVSGGDDGFLKVWDLRQFKSKKPVAIFKHHTEPVTTVEWHPSEPTIFASGGADNQITLWDLAVEKDNETNEEEVKDIPPQLLFIHQGQTDIKELHWHPQLPGVVISTAHSGFNIFKTISV